MYFQTLPQQIWFVLMLLASGYAFWRGGRPERIVAVVNVLAWYLSAIAYEQRDWLGPEWGVFGVDAAFLGILVWLALTTNRLWLLFAAAFQLLSIVTHFAIGADPVLQAWAYRWALVIWSYCVLGSMVVGAYVWSRAGRPSQPPHRQ